MPAARATGTILGTEVEITNLGRTCARITDLVAKREPAYICFATAHMLVLARRNARIDAAYSRAAMVAPDGTPVAWGLQLRGHREASCVSGPRTFTALLAAAEEKSLSVGFYGGRPETLALITSKIATMMPNLAVVYEYSPPFRPLSDAEQSGINQEINASGVQLLFVGLGSPKQELWMHDVSPSLNCVCLGVGAAFEFFSGEKTLPPLWVQQMGLTWLVRLCQEPRRLAGRNLYSFLFVAMFLRQIAGQGVQSVGSLPDSASEPKEKVVR